MNFEQVINHRRAQKVNKYNPSKSAERRNLKMYADLMGNCKKQR